MKRFAAAALLAGLGAGTAQAATIAWTVSDITGNVSDISNNGTFVSATGGSALTSDLTVGGVTFADASNLDPDPDDLFEEIRAVSLPAGFDTGYETLLRSSTRDKGGNADITFAGLIENSQYEIQVWVADDRTADAGVVLSDGVGTPTLNLAGTATVLFVNSANSNAGQYATGIFTADSSGSQSFALSRYTNLSTTPSGTPGNQVIVNAVQLRAVPEPGSLALLGLGGLLIGARRRRA